MRRSLTSLLIAGAALAAGTASAEERGFYVGVGLESLKSQFQGTEQDGDSFDATGRPLALSGRVGYYLFSWLPVEFKASVGVHDDPISGNINGSSEVRNGDLELKGHYGIGVKPQYTVFKTSGTIINLYAVGGWSQIELEGRFENNNAPNPGTVDLAYDDNSPYYGGGIRLDGETGAIFLQYTEYFNESDAEGENGAQLDDVTIDAFQLGVNVFF